MRQREKKVQADTPVHTEADTCRIPKIIPHPTFQILWLLLSWLLAAEKVTLQVPVSTQGFLEDVGDEDIPVETVRQITMV